MLSRDHAVRRRRRRLDWLLRAITTTVALVGILAMHGLTMNHNTTMVAMSMHTAPATAGGPAHAMAVPAAFLKSSAMHAPDEPSALEIAPQATPTLSQRIAPHATGDMTNACVAILTGLLILMATGSTLIRAVRPSDSSHRVRTPPWISAAVDRLRPDLAQLSVLRT